MLSNAHAHPLAYGGAVIIHVTCGPSDHIIIVATATPSAPDPDTAKPSEPRGDTPTARLIHDGLLSRESPHQTRVKGTRTYQVDDLATRHLPDGERVHYWVFQRGTGGTPLSQPLHLAVTPGCTMQTQVQLIRDVVMPRLEYHLERGLREGVITSTADYIPVLEQETVNRDIDLPCVLVKERVVPNPAAATVGDDAGVFLNAQGDYYREFRHPHRVTLDILCLTDSTASRAIMAAYLHGVLVQDKRYWDAAGLQGVQVQRQDLQHIEPQVVLWNVDLTFDCEIEFITRADAPLSTPGDILTSAM